jgi:hypothetical protein
MRLPPFSSDQATPTTSFRGVPKAAAAFDTNTVRILGRTALSPPLYRLTIAKKVARDSPPSDPPRLLARFRYARCAGFAEPRSNGHLLAFWEDLSERNRVLLQVALGPCRHRPSSHTSTRAPMTTDATCRLPISGRHHRHCQSPTANRGLVTVGIETPPGRILAATHHLVVGVGAHRIKYNDTTPVAPLQHPSQRTTVAASSTTTIAGWRASASGPPAQTRAAPSVPRCSSQTWPACPGRMSPSSLLQVRAPAS